MIGELYGWTVPQTCEAVLLDRAFDMQLVSISKPGDIALRILKLSIKIYKEPAQVI